MTLPAGQRLLYRDLTSKLDGLEDETALIRFMGGVLGSLLRRKSDAEFLRKVQDSFTAGLAGRSWAEQTVLAREVIGLVIAKRPEVATAWQKLNNEAPPAFARRASDLNEAPPPADLDDLPDFSLTPEEDEDEDAGDDPYARARAMLAEDLAEVLGRRLALFTVPEPPPPSAVYDHDHPFCLFSPAFPAVMLRFLKRLLAGPMRAELELEVYAMLPAEAAAQDDALRAALVQARPRVFTIMINHLGQLAIQHRAAQAKLVAAETGGGTVEYQEVEVPVTRPRVIHVLGLAFTMGSRPGVKTMRIPVTGASRPDAGEMAALDLATRWHDMAARAGVPLPDACDFTFLRALLQFDADALAAHLPPLVALAAKAGGGQGVPLGKLKALDSLFPPLIVEAAALVLFRSGANGGFGFQELLDFALAPSPRAPRKLLLHEIGRRPRDLAFQIRDALRARRDRNTLGLSVVMLFEVWRRLDRDRFRAELQAALTVFSAFPVAFAGDADERVLTEIGGLLHRAFSTPELDAAGAIESVLRLYGPLARKPA